MFPWHELLANLAVVAIATSVWTMGRRHILAKTPALADFGFGLICAVAVAAVMAVPFQYQQGIYLDTRYTVLALSGLFGGPVSAALPFVFAVGRRSALGGAWAYFGILQIICASGVGLAGYYVRQGRIPSVRLIGIVSVGVGLSGVVGFLVAMDVSSWGRLLVDSIFAQVTISLGSTAMAAFAITQELRRHSTTIENAMYRAIIEALPDALNAKDLSGRFLAANPATAEMMGRKEPGELIGRSDFDFYPANVAKEFRAPEEAVLTSKQTIAVEQKFLKPDGVEAWLMTLKAPMYDASGNVIGVITHNREITERKGLERELLATQDRLTDALASMSDGLALFDKSGCCLFSNQRFTKMFAGTMNAAGTAEFHQLVTQALVPEAGKETESPNDQDRAFALLMPGDRLMKLPDKRWIEARTRITSDGSAMVVFSDVTQHHEREARLQELNARLTALADTDALTGLPNRRAFDAALDHAIENAAENNSGLSLLMIDVDKFKAYNDTYGHIHGDNCLRKVAEALRDVCQPFGGCTVTRYGGEEFAAVLLGLDSDQAYNVARLMCAAVRSLMVEHIGGVKPFVTVSIGVTTRFGAALNRAEILTEADAALYTAKAAGRDCVRSVEGAAVKAPIAV